MTDPIPYVERLRTELVEGVARDRLRRKRRRGAVAAFSTAAVTIAVALAFGLADGGDRSSALAVTKDDRWITVRISDATADPRRMTQELREAGIDGEVRARAVSPSLVGRWAALETRPSTSAGPEQIVSVTELVNEPPGELPPQPDPAANRLSAIDFDPVALRIPRSFDDRVVLTAGRQPRADELYAESASAFAPGEPLHCTGIERLSASDAERAIAARGYEVHKVRERPLRSRQRSRRPDVVIGAQLLATRRLARGVGAPKSRREMLLYVSSSRTTPTPYGIPEQDCGP